MKKLEDIQELIKNQKHSSVFIDYDNLSENLERLYISDAIESRNIRIVRNFLNCDFVKVFVLYKKSIPAKINTRLSKYENITTLKYKKDDLAEICAGLEDDYTFLYIGNNKDITKMDSFKKGFSISINPAFNQTQKVCDFQLSVEELIEFLLETSNVCL